MSTRRNFIAGSAVASVALTLPAAIAAKAVTDRSAWDIAMRAYKKLKAQEEAFTPEYMRVYEAWKAGRPSMDSIDWSEFRFSDRHHIAFSLDLEEARQQFLDGENKWWFGGSAEAVERMKENNRAAIDSVQDFRDANAKHDRESGMDAMDKRSDELADAISAAVNVLLAMPAPDGPALRWKLDYLAEDGLGAYNDEFAAQTRKDIARILGEAG
ncbi:hypothetical protein [Qipengyuania oceanensis]|uniref:Twin-arginine translocation signal domain-containing protein n=1 Tax=Qipengyuania oceanensis TaxID=1463597 RepID=A0A844YHL8_9SPHN|nr:hypothetical protein [Qipengyuania oceanensis]MXO63427.1 hypothetical protein [Qipengyuania oceanensis]